MKSTIFIIFMAITFAIFCTYMYMPVRNNKHNTNQPPPKKIAKYNGTTKQQPKQKYADQLDLTLFTASWCPYCKKLMPEWSKFSFLNSGKVVGTSGRKIKCTIVDCSESSDAADNLKYIHGVNSYPTVTLKMPGWGGLDNYYYKRDEESIDDFVSRTIN